MKGNALVLLILLLSRALLPAGATNIQVVKSNRETINCQLLAVKSNSLVLLVQEGVKLSLPLDHIHSVIIQKKRKYLGKFLAGALAGGLIYSVATGWDTQSFGASILTAGFMAGLVTASFSGFGKKPVEYKLMGKRPLEKAEILHQLKKYALVDY